MQTLQVVLGLNLVIKFNMGEFVCCMCIIVGTPLLERHRMGRIGTRLFVALVPCRSKKAELTKYIVVRFKRLFI